VLYVIDSTISTFFLRGGGGGSRGGGRERIKLVKELESYFQT